MRSFSATGITLTILGILCFLMLWSDKWRGENWKHTIGSDGKGYYSYLPAIFIYGDLNYGFANEYETKYYNTPSGTAYYAPEVDGKPVNKYFGGVALLMAPFFFLAMLFSVVLGLEVDGYSLLFQTGINIAALFYFLAGLWFLRKTLKTYLMPEWVCVLTIIAIGIGTNLIYYTIAEASMSHVYSFFAFSVFIYLCRRILAGYSRSKLLWLAAVFGLILFIRPSNGMILLALPFLSDGWEQFLGLIKSSLADIKSVLMAAGIALAIPALQLLLYYAASGKFFLWSYQGEGFNFSTPEVINVLFSWRKGLFIYTPLLLICLLGLIPLFRKSTFSAFSFLGFFLLTTFVISSWWNWWYGGSFGMRPYIEYYPLFGILLAMLLRTPYLIPRTLVLVSMVLFLSLNLLQSYQAYRMILPWDMMTKEKYWNIFLKTGDIYKGIYTDELFPKPKPAGNGALRFFNDMDSGIEWYDMHTLSAERAFSGKRSSRLDEKQMKSVSFLDTLGRIIPDSLRPSELLVRMQVWMEDISSDASLVVSFERDGKPYQWSGHPLLQQVHLTSTWTVFEKLTWFPQEYLPGDLLTVYVLKSDGSLIYIDDLELMFFPGKQ